jgi:signal transduction histidine kinase
MSFRTRLLISFSAAVILTAGLVVWIVSSATRRAFEERDNQRTAALVTLFRREVARRGDEVVERVEALAAAEGTLRMAIDLSRPDADPAPYVNEASTLATAHGLDLLELISYDGTIVSSAEWPARFGYQADWVVQAADWNSRGAFFEAVELPDDTALALVTVRVVNAGDRNLYLVGGYRLDRQFLASLPLPVGMRALLYRNFPPAQALTDASGPVANAAALQPLIDRVRAHLSDAVQTVDWPDGPETLQAMPLMGRDNNLLGVLLVGSSRRDLAALVRGIRRTGGLAAGIGILLGAALSFWAARRITRPVERLAQGAREVASGNWNARVEMASRDEIGELARAFNSMTLQLVEQRDRLVQTERVAAWRELARRLAHELKNPLFPLQITIENLQRAKEQAPEQFDEVFRESSETLLAELANLKKIIGRFSDFAKMPPPQLERVDVNELVRIECAEDAGWVEADPEQVGRALQNLALNAIDAMPAGGTLRIRTTRRDGTVELDISDTGQGLTKEECERLFTPYYTTKQHGTGLGLAIVQSVVADHKGRISVESEPGRGTTFRIELPEKP